MRGSGADIWNGADAFRFVYQPLSGNGEIRARVSSLTATDPWTKASVMIRQALTAGSPHAMVVVTPGNGTAFQRRTSTGGTSLTTGGPAVTAPYWVRVVRSNNTFTASVSTNGTSWTTVGSVNVSMNSSAYAGMVMTSHDNAVVGTATFSQVTLVPRGRGPAKTPSRR